MNTYVTPEGLTIEVEETENFTEDGTLWQEHTITISVPSGVEITDLVADGYLRSATIRIDTSTLLEDERF